MKMLILRGLSGAGKSTWAHAQEGAFICSADDTHINPDTGAYEFDPTRLPEAHNACFVKAWDACHRGEPLVVIDNTSVTRAEYTPYVMMATAHGYAVELVVVDTPCGVAFTRNTHGVPEQGVANQSENWEARAPYDPEERVVNGE